MTKETESSKDLNENCKSCKFGDIEEEHSSCVCCENPDSDHYMHIVTEQHVCPDYKKDTKGYIKELLFWGERSPLQYEVF